MATTRNQRRKLAREKFINSVPGPIQNSLSSLVDGVRMAAGAGMFGTGGSYLSSSGTMNWSTNYGLVTLEMIMLSYFYASNGLFQTAIQLPVQDGLAKGFEIESGELDAADVDVLMDLWEDKELNQTLLEFMSWVRLYGGGAIIINTDQDPATPLNFKALYGKPVEFYPVDRWELSQDGSAMNKAAFFRGDIKDTDYFYYYGERIHRSRVIIGTGKAAPSRVRRQLSGWGMSEGERMIRDLNLYLKTQDVTYEILDEAKVDVYKISGLAQKLLTPGGTSTIQKRVQLANELKNYLNALVMDKEDDFEQKTMTFSGLSDVMGQNMVGVAAALRMPQVKLFGVSPSGFSTGEADLDNYNQMVEGEIRMKIKPAIRELVRVLMWQKFGAEYSFRIKYPPMKEMDPEKQEAILASTTNRLLAMYDRSLLTSQEFGEEAEKKGLVDVSLKAATGVLPDFPEANYPPAEINLTPPEPQGKKINVLRAANGNPKA